MDKIELKHWFTFQPKEVEKFLKIFYTVGILGFLVPFTANWFSLLTKWALLLNIILILWFHNTGYTKKMIILFITIFMLGYGIELAGVNTGIIFGDYWYGKGLGIRIYHTPLLIGVNWLMLSYCFASLIDTYKIPTLLKILIGSAGMLVYDIILEQSASFLDMWYWKNEVVPLQNYLVWFLVAILFQSLLFGFKIKLRNAISTTILLYQVIFFICLGIYLRVIV